MKIFLINLNWFRQFLWFFDISMSQKKLFLTLTWNLDCFLLIYEGQIDLQEKTLLGLKLAHWKFI